MTYSRWYFLRLDSKELTATGNIRNRGFSQVHTSTYTQEIPTFEGILRKGDMFFKFGDAQFGATPFILSSI